VVGVVGDELIQRIGTRFPIRVARRYLAVSGYDRALALACQAFVALVPMLIVIAATLSERGRVVANGYVVDAAPLRLRGRRPPGPRAATARRDGAHHPGGSGAARPVCVRVHADAATDVPSGVGPADAGDHLSGPEDHRSREQVAPTDASSEQEPLHRPPQQNGQDRVSGVYLQWAIQDQAHRYGLIGVSFVLVSWLIVLGLLLVGGAVVSAEMAHDPPRLRRSAPASPEPSDGG
jgi:hypothetical protein